MFHLYHCLLNSWYNPTGYRRDGALHKYIHAIMHFPVKFSYEVLINEFLISVTMRGSLNEVFAVINTYRMASPRTGEPCKGRLL